MTHFSEELKDIIDNITEGRLKNVTVYQASILGSSHKPMLDYLVSAITELVKGIVPSESNNRNPINISYDGGWNACRTEMLRKYNDIS